MSLEELDYDFNVHNSREADKNLAVRFFLHPQQDDEATIREGRAIFVDTEYVEIRVRGDRNNVVQRPAREDDQKRFRDAYRAFKDNEEQSITGTPLREWPSITRSLLEEMKYLGFHTVEQLANASDSVCSKFAGLQSYKQKAKLFLEFAQGQAPLSRLQKEVAETTNALEVANRNNAEMAKQMAVMQAQIEALQGKKGK